MGLDACPMRRRTDDALALFVELRGFDLCYEGRYVRWGTCDGGRRAGGRKVGNSQFDFW